MSRTTKQVLKQQVQDAERECAQKHLAPQSEYLHTGNDDLKETKEQLHARQDALWGWHDQRSRSNNKYWAVRKKPVKEQPAPEFEMPPPASTATK
jgi:hypothetical protein